ncbi:MAG: TIGR00725 family protein [Asgard group archaeon]|nr:TIGR00725 family protein [Asgard group archaeon]
MLRKKVIGIIGGNEKTCTEKDKKIAYKIGKALIKNNYRIITGGLGGVMEAVSKGGKKEENYNEGMIIGIIPSLNKEHANEYVDIVIATGFNYARNQIIVASSDAIIAIGGGSGTLSEIAFAWQMNKLILAFNTEGWSQKLGNISLDNKRKDKIIKVNSVSEIISILNKKL